METMYLKLSYSEMENFLHWIADKLRRYRNEHRKKLRGKARKEFLRRKEGELTEIEIEGLDKRYTEEEERDLEELMLRLEKFRQQPKMEDLENYNGLPPYLERLKQQTLEETRKNLEMFSLLPEEIKKTVKDAFDFFDGKMKRKTVRLLEKFFINQSIYQAWTIEFSNELFK